MKRGAILVRGHLKVTVEKWKQRASVIKTDTYALYLAYKHPYTPWYAKAFAGLVIAYAFSPIDLVPDFIPFFGYLDDLIIVPLGIALAIKMIPAEVMVDCRKQAQSDMGGEKRINWLVAVIIITIWVGVAMICILWLLKFLR
jgi:uncharacterized membrane protein YkvA (DUF1232 family)